MNTECPITKKIMDFRKSRSFNFLKNGYRIAANGRRSAKIFLLDLKLNSLNLKGNLHF